MGYTIIVIILTVACNLIDQGYSQDDGSERIPFAWSNCTVPPEPINGSRKLHKSHCCSEHNISCDHCDIKQGVRLNPGMSLIYTCNPGFKLNRRTNRVYCDSDDTLYNIPNCVEIRCTNLPTALIKFADCVNPDGSIGSCEEAAIGTTTRIVCPPGYKHNPPYNKSTVFRCTEFGYFKPIPIRCIPACGVLPLNLTTRMEDGSQAMITEFPWHATLYEAEGPDAEKEFICGASMIREDLLLTAAHCVYGESIQQVKDPRRYYVAAGNVYRDYDSPLHDTRIVKKSQVKYIYMHPKFSAYYGNYGNDIALLQIEKPFQFTATLLPICLDVSNYGVETGTLGRVAGFVRTDVNSPSTYTLQAIRVSCFFCPLVPKKYIDAMYLAHEDKFCAVHTNRSSVCNGDSGSGLVFQNSLDGLWYLQGIVSTSPGTQSTERSNVHNSVTSCLCTRVSKHLTWIRSNMFAVINYEYIPINRPPLDKPARNNESIPTESTIPFARRSCTVPPEPINGSRKFHKSHCCSEHNISCDHCNIKQGVRLDPGMSLIYSCNPGFKLNGSNHVLCGWAGIWYNIPDCVEIRCTSLLSASVFADCVKPDGSFVSCENPAIGTTTKLDCRPGYKQNPSYIKNREYRCNETGYWEPEPIRCIPACGVLPINLAPRIVGGSQAMITEFPWHATLYEAERPDAEKEFICGASIIREDLLLTAAHCVHDESIQQVKDPRRYYVATGNVYRDYNSPLHDSEVVKKSQVKNIHIICNYHGYEGNYALDIALLQIEQPFQFTSTLVPICLDGSDHDIKEGEIGRVAGFGRTGVDSPSSYILQTIRAPYVNFSLCSQLAYALQSQRLLTEDKFCAGYTNGSSICDGDSGSGLFFQRNKLWYLQGIASNSLGTRPIGGSNICNSDTYSLYIRVPKHMSWIRETMSKVEKHEYIPSCPRN